MPVKSTHSRAADAKRGETKLVFGLPFNFIGSAARASVEQARCEATAHREEMLAFQKQARDPETARFFKEQARDALKTYRAACLLLPWVSGDDLPGDCPLTDPYGWPQELFPALCRVSETALIAA